MKHIIRIVHRLTKDQKGVFFSCEENGAAVYVSDLKPNGNLHINNKDGAMVSLSSVHLFRAYTQERLLSFAHDASRNAYSGVFYGPDNAPCGNIAPVGTGCEQYYVAQLYGVRYECYKWTVGTAPCMMFYKNGVQVAMLVEDKISVNQMYSMTIHIADDEDVPALCMLGYIYHQFENVRNMNSRFHRSFIRNGWCISLCENVANYHFEVHYKGVGKSKYDPEFLRQFYPDGYFPYQDEPVTAKDVFKELGTGMSEAAGQAWTEENLNKSLRNPLAIVLLVGMPVLFGLIGGLVGWSMLLAVGIDISDFDSGIRFLIGFLVFFIMVALCEGIFLLFYKWLVSVFDKSKKK